MSIDIIAKKWQKRWDEAKIYQIKEDTSKPKFYVLDMFPYPSGAGLHVWHPKGYIASDVISRKKLLEWFNVLHPMGFDTFGLGTENYAIENKMKPQVAAANNISTFKDQLEKFGFTYDWDREVNTADPEYFKWTQKIFLDFYNHYFDQETQKARPICELRTKLETQWESEENIRKILDSKRLAYIDYKPINRCPECKTGLANEDLDNGKCERCASIVEQKPMRQWVLRITEYSQRLIDGLEKLDRDPSMKELQKNWIGKSVWTQFKMDVDWSDDFFEVYTTRVDTVFGMSFVAIAPEHPLVEKITTDEYRSQVDEYVEKAKHKTQLERTELQKDKSWVFCGAFAINPFNGEKVKIFVADYVLAGYGTGVVMAVPAHDERDFEFAQKYDLPIKQTIWPLFWEIKNKEIDKLSGYALIHNPKIDKYLVIEKSDWESFGDFWLPWWTIENWESLLDWTLREVKEETWYKNLIIKSDPIYAQAHYFAVKKDVQRLNNAFCYLFELENEEQDEQNLTEFETTLKYKRLTLKEVKKWIRHDVWNFFVNHLMSPSAHIEKGILVNSGEFSWMTSDQAIEKMQEWLAKNNIWWKKTNFKIQDWVFSRQRYWGEPIPFVFCDKCWVVALEEKDLPLNLPDVENYEPTGTEEWPLANIDEWINTTCPTCGWNTRRESNTMPWWAGSSWYWIRYMDPRNNNELVWKWADEYRKNVDVYVWGAEHVTRHMIYARFWQNFLYDLDVVSQKEPFQKYQKVWLIMGEDKRKMSKRRWNVVNPDDVIAENGSDALRVYEMFMGPFDQSIDWNTNGVKWVKKFLDKVTSLFNKVAPLTKGGAEWNEAGGSDADKTLNILHNTIKKVTEDIDTFWFNTAISQMMILVNHLQEQNSISRNTFEILVVLLSPFAPHLAEELWEKLGNEFSVFTKATRPKFEEKYLVANTVKIAVQFNGKVRWTLEVDVKISQDEFIELLKNDGKLNSYMPSEAKKIIFIPGKICNIVG